MPNRIEVVQNALERLLFLHLLARLFLHGPNLTELLQQLPSSHKRYEISYCFDLRILKSRKKKIIIRPLCLPVLNKIISNVFQG